MTQEQTPLHQNEEIVPIQGYEGLYSITSFGRVWSHERLIKFGRGYRYCGNKFLISNSDSNDYPIIQLCRNRKRVSKLIHILVAQAFIPNLNNLPEVNHKDGDKQNCGKDNLEWCTKQENMNHALTKGLLRFKKSSKYYGVSIWNDIRHKNTPWRAFTHVNKKQELIGCFKTEVEAAKTYNNYVIEHNLNKPLNILNQNIC